ncbi:MAG: hypothetical protein DI598_01615 [Pseudopedobacter saltans]|uniref:Helix-turn-helix domain-containing protein n=1 Tax=Pseudopedobacter saltans TaxID=151895 RepID=A0A2W5F7Q8_9SPHI|nr:MAG: hypothetical protein DI598_01615 [Pseudopedobacter saltans]
MQLFNLNVINMVHSVLIQYSEKDFKELLKEVVKSAVLEAVQRVIEQQINSPPKVSPLLNRKQVCELLNITLPTLYKLESDGILKPIILGGSYRYSQKKIEDIINK